MHWTRTKFWHLAAAAGVGGACWALAAGVSPGQTNASDSNQTTQRGQQATQQQPSQQQPQLRSDQYGQSGTSQQGQRAQTQSQRYGQTNQAHDAIGQPRDDMRNSDRTGRDQYQSGRDQSQAGRQYQGTQNQNRQNQSRDAFRGARDEDNDEITSTRDEYGNQRQRSTDRDSDRSQYSNQTSDQSQRGSDRDQYSNQSRQGQRDNDRDQSSDRGYAREDRSNQGRSDQYQSGSFDQRGGRQDYSRQDFQSQSARSSTSGQSSGQHASSQHQISRSADIGLWFDRSNRNGLVISDVSSSGPISRFGFRDGDQIMTVNGQRVASEQQFISTLMSPQLANQRIPVMVWRNGQQVPVYVEPWALTQHYQQSSGHAQADALEPYGIVLDDRYQAPVVWKVTPRSPAYYAGIRGNDVIVAWNSQHVNDPEELENAVQQTDRSEIPVQISRNRQLRNLTLEADGQTRTALRPSYDQSYDTSSQQGGYGQQSTDGYAQPQGYQQGQTYQQGYTQPQTYQQQGGTYQQQGTYQQNRPGILPRLRGRE